MSISQTLHIVIPDGCHDRLDKLMAANLPEGVTLSRSRIQELIIAGAVFDASDMVIKNGKHKASGGETYRLEIPASRSLDIEAQNIPLDIIYEDDDLLVVNKPSGMVVHPARGQWDGTLVNAIMYHCGDTLSGIGGVERPGIVHRIDKETSGLLVVAKNDRAHEGLGQQFRAHSINRVYRAFVYGRPHLGDAKMMGMAGVTPRGIDIRVDRPIDRHPHDRLRMAVRDGGKHAITHIRPVGVDASGTLGAVECRLETGRTHQIRVHMTHLGFPLLGDPMYGRGSRHLSHLVAPELATAIAGLSGQALHAAELGFVHPITGEDVNFTSTLPDDMAAVAAFFE